MLDAPNFAAYQAELLNNASHINALKLSARTRNALVRSGITLVGRLARASDFELLGLHQIGVTSIQEIHEALIAYQNTSLYETGKAESGSVLQEAPSHVESSNAVSRSIDKHIYNALIPIDHFDYRIWSILRRAGIITIGQLASHDFTLYRIPHIGSKAQAEIATFLDLVENDPDFVESLGLVIQQSFGPPADLVESLSTDAEKTIADQTIHYINPAVPYRKLIPTSESLTYTSSGIPVLPRHLKEIIKTALNQTSTNNRYDVLARRFGAEGARIYTLDEIGLVMGITRERVRQIEGAALERVKYIVMGRSARGLDSTLHPAIQAEIQALIDTLRRDGPLLDEERLWHSLEERYAIELSTPERAFCRILFETVDFIYITLRRPRVTIEFPPAWITQPQCKDDILRAAPIIVELFHTQLDPVSLYDLMIEVNRKSRKQHISKEVLHAVLQLCPSVEMLSDDNFRTAFEFLNNYVQRAYRVLDTKKTPMSSTDITNEINHLLAKAGEPPNATIRAVTSRFTASPDIVPIGRSSMWALKKWGVETRHITQLIEEFLHLHKRPASVSEIAAYVLDKRAAQPSSIRIYLSIDKRFQRVGHDEYALTVWGGTPYHGRSATLKAGFDAIVKTIFEEKGCREMTLDELQREVASRLGCSIGVAWRRARSSPMLDILPHPRNHQHRLVRLRDKARRFDASVDSKQQVRRWKKL